MRDRLTVLRRWPLRLAKDRARSGQRAFSFTQGMAAAQWHRSGRTRPQLPFLVIPSSSSASSPQQFRYFTTKRRRWLQHEALAFVRYTVYFWTAVGCFVAGQFVVQQEWMEQAHPTPREWSYMSRMRLRGALSEREGSGQQSSSSSSISSGVSSSSSAAEDLATEDVHIVDHVRVIQILLDLLARLEDPRIDGGSGLLGVLDAEATWPSENAILADFESMDIRAKDEPWRRGYFEALLAAAESSEHVEGWLLDRTRNIVCPPDLVIGPSNPHPRPLPPGASGAPREENCAPCFPSPAELYLKLLHTRGLTTRQQITAALAFANYLEYKNDTDAAEYVYGRAVLAATQPHEDPSTPILAASFSSDTDVHTWIRRWTDDSSTAVVSQNLLQTLMAYATFQARSGNVAAALPIFVGMLKARRSLPPARDDDDTAARRAAAAAQRQAINEGSLLVRLIALAKPPAYPPPPDDGWGPPLPGPQTRCDEAALLLHIGEILYASASNAKQKQAAREEGIAWTREAVDMAEEQLHKLAEREKEAARTAKLLSQSAPPPSPASRAACRQCLVAGLDNWTAMVGRLARDEEKRRAAEAAAAAAAAAATAASGAAGSWWWPSWLSFWGSAPAGVVINGTDHKQGRWTAEQSVIQDRRRRAKELVEDVAAPPAGFLSLFSA